MGGGPQLPARGPNLILKDLAELRGLLDLIALDAGSANANSLRRAGNHRTNLLEIDIPAPVGNIVSVADLVPKLRAAATYIAYSCHYLSSETTQDNTLALVTQTTSWQASS